MTRHANKQFEQLSGQLRWPLNGPLVRHLTGQFDRHLYRRLDGHLARHLNRQFDGQLSFPLREHLKERHER